MSQITQFHIGNSALSIDTITGNSGGPIAPDAFGNFNFSGGTTGLTFAGSAFTETLTGTLVIANGGTNATSFANTNGVVYFDGTRLVDTTVGTSGQFLKSRGIGLSPIFDSLPASSITIAGDVGSTAGNSFTFTGGTSGAVFTMAAGTMTESFNFLSLPVTSATNGQILINAIPALQMYGTQNAFGGGAGNFTLTVGSAIQNTAFGFGALRSLTTGTNNSVTGQNSGADLTTGSRNQATGPACFVHATSANDNAICGFQAGFYITTGSFNCGIGTNLFTSVANGLLTGSYNVGVGALAGTNMQGAESSNIYINAPGVTAESNVCRIGAGTGAGNQQLDATFIHGIRGVTPSVAGALVTVTDANGQLGTITNGTAGWVLTSNGAAANPSFQAASGGGLTYAEETGANKTIDNNFEYGANRGGGVAFALPATAAVGTRFAITGIAGLWSITQAANQSIRLGSTNTTVGVGGSLTATNAGDCILCTCIVADLIWRCTASFGNPAVV